MSYKVLFSLRANQELLKDWEWYEDRQPGLGDRFKEAVYKQVHQIEAHPERYPERRKNYREIKIAVFPYLLIYRMKKRSKEILIVSIFHTSRSPRKKYQ